MYTLFYQRNHSQSSTSSTYITHLLLSSYRLCKYALGVTIGTSVAANNIADAVNHTNIEQRVAHSQCNAVCVALLKGCRQIHLQHCRLQQSRRRERRILRRDLRPVNVESGECEVASRRNRRRAFLGCEVAADVDLVEVYE